MTRPRLSRAARARLRAAARRVVDQLARRRLSLPEAMARLDRLTRAAARP